MNSIVGIWRHLGARADRIERQSPFDPLSYPVYSVLIGALLIELVLIFATNFTVAPNIIVGVFIIVLFLALAALLARAYGMPKIALALDAIALPTIIGGLTATATILISAVSLPFADDKLAAADRLIGFDWVGFYRFNLSHPWFVEITRYAYKSIFWQVTFVPIILALVAGRERFWQFMCAWTIASAITVLIYPLLPAAGP